jgi:hypothetical protein
MLQPQMSSLPQPYAHNLTTSIQQPIAQLPPGNELSGQKGCVWRVRTDPVVTNAVVRESADLRSPEKKQLLPGDTCIQAGPMVKDQSGVVRMPIDPTGWVSVHARALNGPTFLEMIQEPQPAPVQLEEPQEPQVAKQEE